MGVCPRSVFFHFLEIPWYPFWFEISTIYEYHIRTHRFLWISLWQLKGATSVRFGHRSVMSTVQFSQCCVHAMHSCYQAFLCLYVLRRIDCCRAVTPLHQRLLLKYCSGLIGALIGTDFLKTRTNASTSCALCYTGQCDLARGCCSREISEHQSNARAMANACANSIALPFRL